MSGRALPETDLAAVLRDAPFEDFRRANIFLTGGTGFFGHWLLESLLLANERLGLGLRVTVLTRDARRFAERNAHLQPHLDADGALTVLEGDAATFDFPGPTPTHILHAATDSVVRSTEQDLAQSVMAGTSRVLELARRAAKVQAAEHRGPVRLLYISSGAVYGRGIRSVRQIAESFPLAAQDGAGASGEGRRPPQNYDEAKRASEQLCLASASNDLVVAVARCFAFAGPHLPLDAHFAIGNFIRDAMAGRPIEIQGDGTPLRSFLYMSDLAAWLWTMLARAPQSTVLNVGSGQAVSIRELAELTAATLHPGLAVRVAGTPDRSVAAPTYVPDITAARAFGLRPTVDLAEAIRRTAAWNGWRPPVR